jgi:NADPH2:quinone reductase
VRIAVQVAGLNYADIMQRKGLYLGGPKPPFGAGFEVAGVVDSVGPKASQWRVGDAVMGFCSAGYSEYVVADAVSLLKKPDRLSFNEAAAIPCQYLTAYHALLTLGRLSAGQTVLIHAAAGGLGTLLVQIARNVGATIIGTCSTDAKCAFLREIGCHHPINYATSRFLPEVQRLTGRQGCDLVIESVGGDVFGESLHCVKPRGHLIVLGVASAQPRSIQVLELLFRNITVSGFHLSGYSSDAPAMANAVRDLHAWLETGKLALIVKHVFRLEEAAQAHELIESRKSSGKIVLAIGG